MKCFPFISKDKKRSFHCKILLLDDTQLIHEVQNESLGQELMDLVCRHLNLLETAYFGLRFMDESGQPRWLNLSRRIGKQLKGTQPMTLYFGVKFYAVDPCKLAEEITRYQFFLQLKQDIVQSRLPVTFDLATELFALSIQSELGDFDSNRHEAGYVSEFRFLPTQTKELETRVAELHKRLTGQLPSSSEMAFLERVKWLDLYGADLHQVVGEDNEEYFIGLNPNGVIVLRNKCKVANYFWPKIVKVKRKKRFFMLTVMEKNCCSEHKTFFTLALNNFKREAHRMSGFTQRFRSSFTSRYGPEFDNPVPITPSSHGGREDRMQPKVIRVPSRRFNRRNPSGDDNSEKSSKPNHEPHPPPCSSHRNECPVPVTSSSSYDPSNAPSAWDINPRKSQKDAFSLQLEKSVAGGDHCDLNQYARSSSRTRPFDNDSQVSRTSRQSRHSHRSGMSHKSHCKHHSLDQDGSEVGSTRSRRKRRRHRCSSRVRSTEQLIDSQPQWNEIQKMRMVNQMTGPTVSQAVLKHVHSVDRRSQSIHREPEYANSVQDTSIFRSSVYNNHKPAMSERSLHSLVPPDVKKLINFNPIVDTTTSPKQNDLQYTESKSDRVFRVRYSPTTGRAKGKLTSIPTTTASLIRPVRTSHYEDNLIQSTMSTMRSSDQIYSNVPHTHPPPPPYTMHNLQSAGSRAPVSLSFNNELDLDSDLKLKERDDEMATEL